LFAVAVEEVRVRLAGLQCERLLDRFYVVSETESLLRAALLTGFFDAIAEKYRELVDPQRNRENIECLIRWLVRDLHAGEGPLIDLGCGTGLSTDVAEKNGRAVIGIEASARMRSLAESAGMEVIAPGDVSTLPYAAGAFASYVLHLEPTPQELPALLSRLSNGASLVANVHKGRGLAELEGYVRQIGASFDRGPCHPQHGQYVRIHVG
jgi:SAM-dependent methyltransferase